MKKIIVTGGAGFIGRNLIQTLLDQGNQVISIDNYYSGFEENYHSLKSPPGRFSWFCLSVQQIREAYLDIIFGDCSEIYHLACPASPPKYQADPVYTMHTCFNGTWEILKLAEKIRAKVLFSSTSEIYGDPEVHPQNENYRGCVNTVGPRSNYDEGKRIAESLCYEFQNKGVDVKIARIFNTYGPFLDINDGRVVSNFIKQGLARVPLTIYGDGTQTRSLCYVDDMVTGLIRLMESGETRPVNLGNPDEITVMDLAKEVSSFLGRPFEFEFKPLPQDDPRQRCPDISRAVQSLSWKPVVNRQEGLERTIKWINEKTQKSD